MRKGLFPIVIINTVAGRFTHDDVIKWKHFRVTGHLCREFTGHRWISRTKVIDAELSCFFDLRLNKRLSKQWWGWWFETPSHPLRRHCIVIVMRGAIPFHGVTRSCITIVHCWQNVTKYRHQGPALLLQHDAVARIFSQWGHSFRWKLHCYWQKFLRQRQLAVMIQDPGTDHTVSVVTTNP